MNIQFQDLITGKTDARNEVLLNNENSVSDFKDVFVKPSGFPLRDYINGETFFISGLKGTGKTTLLKYIAINLNEKYSADFVYFKSDLKEDDREEIDNYSTFQVIDENGIEKKDFEKAWKWFIIRKLVENNDKFGTFVDNECLNKTKEHLMSVNLEKSKKGLSYFFPRIKNGKVGIKIPNNVALDFELEFKDKEENFVKFNDVVDKCYDLFLSLTPKRPLFLFIDELELSYLSRQSYDRDASLIRDLIVTIKELNQEFREWEMGIYVVAAIRAEVITAVGAIGKEISKHIEDFGYTISWYRAQASKIDHPLIQMLINRIRKSEEKKYNRKINISNKKVWDNYFPSTIYGKKSTNVLLNMTWYRPRDLIRWLIVAKQNFPEYTAFSQEIFDNNKKDYSRRCLNEVFEELNAIYSKDELQGLEKIFIGFKAFFTPDELKEHILKLSKDLDEVRALLTEERNFNRLIDHLYSCGVIGNIYETVNASRKCVRTIRWYCRGDSVVINNKAMQVHPALRPALSIRDY